MSSRTIEIHSDSSEEDSIMWTDEETRALLLACSEYVNKHGFDTDYKWDTIRDAVEEATGQLYTKFQCKNKFESIRPKARVWTALRFTENEVLWDRENGRIRASDKWWEENIKVFIITSNTFICILDKRF